MNLVTRTDWAGTNPTKNSLEALVVRLIDGGISALGDAWDDWFVAAADQIVTDPLMDPELSDQMVEALTEAEDSIFRGLDAKPAVERIIGLYQSSRDELNWETKCRNRAAELGPAELGSPFWMDLHEALEAAEKGEVTSVECWLDEVEETFLRSLDTYESGDLIEEEISQESVLCHRFLIEGAECWLGALSEFRESLGKELDRTEILARAGQGQRLLVLVKQIEKGVEEAASQVLAWARS